MFNRNKQEFNSTFQPENTPGAYMIFAPNYEKAYFGSSKHVRTRLLRHYRDLCGRIHDNYELQQLFNKWGPLLQLVICPTETKEEALDIEQNYIDLWFGTNAICNLAQDARSSGVGYKPTAETVEKIRQANLGKPKSAEHRAAIAKTLTGRPASPEVAERLRTIAIGRVVSDATREKMSASSKGRTMSEESRKKMSEAAKNRIVSIETRMKQSALRSGKSIILSERARLDLIERTSKPVTIDNCHYPSIKIAAETLGLTIKVVSSRLASEKYPTWIRDEKA